MSDSVQPHRRKPTRLPRPWDSPGKNTGVSCHFLLQCMKVKSESEVAQLCPTLCDPMDCSPPGSSIHGIFQARVLEWGAIAFSIPSFYFPPIHVFQFSWILFVCSLCLLSGTCIPFVFHTIPKCIPMHSIDTVGIASVTNFFSSVYLMSFLFPCYFITVFFCIK